MSFDRSSGHFRHPSAAPAGDIWAGFKPAESDLEGIVTDANLDSAAPSLQVRGPDGRNWTIELADRRRTLGLGLSRAALLPGDPVRLTGRRSERFGEQRMKALRLTVAGRSFDLFPAADAQAAPQPEPA